MNIATRLQRLHASMLDNNLDALIYGTGANFQYFTGSTAKWRRMEEPAEPAEFMVLTADRSPAEMKVVRANYETSSVLKSLIRGGRVGVSLTAHKFLSEIVRAAVPGAECVDAEGLGEAIRLLKDPGEIAILRRAAALTDMVMDKVVDAIRPGVTQSQLSAMIARQGLALGAQDVSFPPAALFVKSGSEPTEDPFVYPQDKGLVPGTSIAFDFGFLVDGYCSDFGRSFYCGPAPDHISGAYRALQEAQCEMVSRLKPGQVRLSEVFGIIEAALDQRGYGDRLRARLKDGTIGHNIGVDLHENPWLRPGNDAFLQPGMVMAIEPKVWLPGEYYLRVEDIVLITKDGAESLNSFDRVLFGLPV